MWFTATSIGYSELLAASIAGLVAARTGDAAVLILAIGVFLSGWFKLTERARKKISKK